MKKLIPVRIETEMLQQMKQLIRDQYPVLKNRNQLIEIAISDFLKKNTPKS